MKKRIALIALVSILAITSVFAGGLFNAKKGPDISVGAKTGYEMEVYFPEKLDSYSTNNVPVLVDAVFGVTDNFAVGTDLGMNIFIPEKGDSVVSFATDVLAYYVLPLSNQFNLYLGGGLGFDTYSKSETVASIKSTASNAKLSLQIEARAAYDVTEHINVFGAFDFGVNVLNQGTLKVSGNQVTTTNAPTSILWGINVGCAYKF